MATDYVTSPYTEKGKIIFGIGLGLITVIIRRFGSMTEGVSYAILLMNLVVPYINKATRQKPLGAPKAVKEAK
jgi:electron transport complex protein RnfD